MKEPTVELLLERIVATRRRFEKLQANCVEDSDHASTREAAIRATGLGDAYADAVRALWDLWQGQEK